MRFWRIYLGERDTDFTCYAVFFNGESDKEIRRIKYFNGEEVTPTEERTDVSLFIHAFTIEKSVSLNQKECNIKQFFVLKWRHD